MSDVTFTYDKSETLPANGFSRTGYYFDGWNESADGTADNGRNYPDRAAVKTLPSYRMVWLHCMHSGNRAVIHLHSIITNPAMQPELSGIQTKRHGQSRLMQV